MKLETFDQWKQKICNGAIALLPAEADRIGYRYSDILDANTLTLIKNLITSSAKYAAVSSIHHCMKNTCIHIMWTT